MTTDLTRRKSVIVIEDLNVSGMLKNGRLSRAISDVGFCEVRRQFTYKGDWNACLILTADRFYPSSKLCSVCGWINEDLKLSDREWVCHGCGTIHDRDDNASQNLEDWGEDALNALLADSSSESLNARGGEGSGLGLGQVETNPCEAGIRHGISEVAFSYASA
jgi:putative transposase